MTYKCLECGHIFEDGEEAHWSESRGEFWGRPCSEEMTGCPLCKGDYAETEPCDICGSAHLPDELTSGVCEECIEEYRYDINTCFEIGKNENEKIPINCFLASLFDKDEIEDILFKALLKEEKIYNKKTDCKQFIDSDKNWFAERLAEEVKKNENSKK
jgi:hypothetical protein